MKANNLYQKSRELRKNNETWLNSYWNVLTEKQRIIYAAWCQIVDGEKPGTVASRTGLSIPAIRRLERKARSGIYPLVCTTMIEARGLAKDMKVSPSTALRYLKNRKYPSGYEYIRTKNLKLMNEIIQLQAEVEELKGRLANLKVK